MLFDLLRKFGYVRYFDNDGGSGGGGKTEDGTEEKSEKDNSDAGDDKDKGKAKKEDKLFTQAELDAIIDDRLKRERKKSEDVAEKARKKAEDEALAKNQEWQKLAETREKEIADIAKEKSELEPFKEQAERYRAALNAQLAKVKERLPKYLLPLIEKMDPVEAMAYITEHAEEIGAGPETYGETPKSREKKVSDDDKKKAQDTVASVITRSF
jgi:hypothetical protein